MTLKRRKKPRFGKTNQDEKASTRVTARKEEWKGQYHLNLALFAHRFTTDALIWDG
jgi:hypothetical protein